MKRFWTAMLLAALALGSGCEGKKPAAEPAGAGAGPERPARSYRREGASQPHVAAAGTGAGTGTGAAAVAPPAPVTAEHATLPMLEVVQGASIYDLPAKLVDHHGKDINLGVWRGQPTLIAMFYASCPQACPLLIGNIQFVESRLTEAERAGLRVLLVSFEPEADTPEVLRAVLPRHGLDGERWRLARADEETIRDVAAVLGIAYRPLDGGDFNHASAITLLDRDGKIVARQDGLVRAAEPLQSAIAAQFAKGKAAGR